MSHSPALPVPWQNRWFLFRKGRFRHDASPPGGQLFEDFEELDQLVGVNDMMRKLTTIFLMSGIWLIASCKGLDKSPVGIANTSRTQESNTDGGDARGGDGSVNTSNTWAVTFGDGGLGWWWLAVAGGALWLFPAPFDPIRRQHLEIQRNKWANGTKT